MINQTIIKKKKDLKLNNPILIVGLPGIGNVGKLVSEHLRREFKAKRIATLYSPHFPHQVVMLKNGKVRIVSNRFYLIKAKKGQPNDIVLLTGDVQAVTPEGQYEVNSKIVDFFKDSLGGKFIYTIGGYNIGKGMETKPKVFANATSQQVIDQFKGTDIIFGKSRGVIWGSAGLIIAFAKMKKIDAICLMGETSFLEVDAAAAKSVITQLAKKLNLTINTADLDKIIAKTAKAIIELEKQAGMGINMGQPQAFPLPGSSADTESERRPSYIR